MRAYMFAITFAALTSTAYAETFEDRWKGMFRARDANNSTAIVQPDQAKPVAERSKKSVKRIALIQRKHYRGTKKWRSRQRPVTTSSSAPTLKSILWPF